MRKRLMYFLTVTILLSACVVLCNAASLEDSLWAAADGFAAMAEMLANRWSGVQNGGGNPDERVNEQAAASAAPAGSVQYQSSGIWYIILDDGTIEITKYTGNDTNVVISSAYDGRNVSRIGESAFEECTTIEMIIMLPDVTEIGKAAFSGCTRLKSFSIPSSVTVINDSVFENCSDLERIIILGDIVSIGRNAFRNCTSLKSVSIPDSCLMIGESAFEGCECLGILVLLGGESIGAGAFKDCVSLKSVSFPNVITEIGDYAFAGCRELENAIVWGKNVTFGENTFADCPKLAKLPEGAGKNSTAENTVGTTGGIRPDFKKAMDAYESFYTEYCSLLAEYKKNPTNLALLTRYYQLVAKVDEIDKAFDAWDDSDMSTEELKYYLEVNNRVMQMLVDVMN